MWTVTVAGTPKPKGSLKCVGQRGRHQLVEDDSTGKGKTWRAVLTQAGEAVAARVGDRLQSGPVSVEVTFTLDRPGSAPRSRLWPAVRNGDVDKLARMLLDAFTDAKVWGDDSQVVELIARKAYPLTGSELPGMATPCPGAADRPGATVRVWATDQS